MWKIVSACLALCAAACSQPSPPPAPAGGIAVSEAWAAPTPQGVAVSAGYLTIVNSGDGADALIGARSPRAERVEIHETTMEGAVMRMRAVERLELAPGAAVMLAPGGRHLMFIGVAEAFAPGEEIPLQLAFEHAGEVEVTLPVRAPGAGHSGH